MNSHCSSEVPQINVKVEFPVASKPPWDIISYSFILMLGGIFVPLPLPIKTFVFLQNKSPMHWSFIKVSNFCLLGSHNLDSQHNLTAPGLWLCSCKDLLSVFLNYILSLTHKFSTHSHLFVNSVIKESQVLMASGSVLGAGNMYLVRLGPMTS